MIEGCVRHGLQPFLYYIYLVYICRMKRNCSKSFFIAAVMVSGMCGYATVKAQTGISISPPRIYYAIGPGQSQTEKVLVSNPSVDYTLELGVSFEDWAYNEFGDNLMYEPGTLSTSCAAWIAVPEAYFSLAPGESKELDVQMTMPADYRNDTVPVHTAILYVTQLNPRDGVDQEGANIKIAVRTGIKLYQRMPGGNRPDLDITDFKYDTADNERGLVLFFDNISNTWADGRISLELLNQSTGTKTVLPDVTFYSMPGDRRQQYLALPNDLESARYIATAIVNYGDTNTVKIAELEFRHEN